MFPIILLALECVLLSTALYLYLHIKTRMRLLYLFIDNFIVSGFAIALSWFLLTVTKEPYLSLILFVNLGLVPMLIVIVTLIRFWRAPKRYPSQNAKDIVSAADGKIIYIKNIPVGHTPISIKGTTLSKLDELAKTDLLNRPCWLIGVNMTPFDVHKNCSPIDGRIILNQHFNGHYLSLKHAKAISENERNTYVIENDDLDIRVGVIQIASKRVRRIDSYANTNEFVKKGQWIGMIRFGSQVDVILPEKCIIEVKLNEQVYACKTVIARMK